ncbi:NlpC/P60 family protein [Jeotgalibacillus sp. ET6]|uniref:C40 family peptidase n=1 Tax=Jeotgalibacillus sp. ET6 TaxID=3037260 RepID=UPI00241841FD|nr:C40 family peptidase [Jeotgalibacillus sp. ET6]MDG5471465.1 NlpC/P60 family protein [Jeotgalibacillus sp. ET6]
MKKIIAAFTIILVFFFVSLVSEAEVSEGTYKVKAGDTLWSIAAQYSTTVRAIQSLNELTSDLIVTHQMLKVPQTDTVPEKQTEVSQTYTVKTGDTLFSIANRYEMTVDQLKDINQLSGNLLLPGQELKVAGESSYPVVPAATVSDSWLTDVLDIAGGQIGVPYVWGGATPDGFDCSGFVYYVFNEAGFEIARTTAEDQHARALPVDSPQQGDLVFFENTYKAGISHVGIYLGNDQFIHANDGDGVQISPLSNPYWQEKLEGFGRLTGE